MDEFFLCDIEDIEMELVHEISIDGDFNRETRLFHMNTKDKINFIEALSSMDQVSFENEKHIIPIKSVEYYFLTYQKQSYISNSTFV